MGRKEGKVIAFFVLSSSMLWLVAISLSLLALACWITAFSIRPQKAGNTIAGQPSLAEPVIITKPYSKWFRFSFKGKKYAGLAVQHQSGGWQLPFFIKGDPTKPVFWRDEDRVAREFGDRMKDPLSRAAVVLAFEAGQIREIQTR